MHQEKDHLWAKVLSCKFRNPRRNCSRTWLGMKKGNDVFTQGCKWKVGSNSSLNFWHDKWLTDWPLRSLISGPLNRDEDCLMVRKVTQEGRWDVSRISMTLPQDIFLRIKAILIPLSSMCSVAMTWSLSPSGDFDGRSAYKLAKGKSEATHTFTGQWIWKLVTLPKLQCFVWRCYLHSLTAKDMLMDMGISEDNICEICGECSENIMHVLQDNDFGLDFWLNSRFPNCDYAFFNTDLCSWFETCAAQADGDVILSWNHYFSFGIWSLWNHRNERLFKQVAPSRWLDKEVRGMAINYIACAGHMKQVAARRSIMVRWSRPNMSWSKLNTNGSPLGNPGLAGGGGFIRDHNGCWLAGFSRAIGQAMSVKAELWPLRKGLQLCIARNLQAVQVELDAKVVMNWMSSSACISTAHSSLITNCKFLLAQIPRVKINHCFREANQCTDKLAKNGASQTSGLRGFA